MRRLVLIQLVCLSVAAQAMDGVWRCEVIRDDVSYVATDWTLTLDRDHQRYTSLTNITIFTGTPEGPAIIRAQDIGALAFSGNRVIFMPTEYEIEVLAPGPFQPHVLKADMEKSLSEQEEWVINSNDSYNLEFTIPDEDYSISCIALSDLIDS